MNPDTTTLTPVTPVDELELDEGRDLERGEEGQATVEWLGIAALSIAAIVAIFAGLQALGLDVIDSVRTQLGL